ncbi:C-C motif chemokine 8-like [Meriones unguiculatus]|uniref:C-C motif chemokine 8-like n=1 Tax=Meriones unguiculatus TaxID=10047 RepID=UPI000B4FB6C5|nr:C-C motif chemokine 8-like [Meriones unguiculatus]
MKFSIALLCLLLTAVIVSPEEQAGPDKASVPVSCCFVGIKRRIPFKMVQSYRRTSIQCPWEAVVFKTKNGRLICADPTENWVNSYVVLLDQKSQSLQP